MKTKDEKIEAVLYALKCNASMLTGHEECEKCAYNAKFFDEYSCNGTQIVKDAISVIEKLRNKKNESEIICETEEATEENEKETTEKAERKTNDNVNHPSHYTFGSIEVIEYIRDKLSPEEFQGYCEGNVLKYVSRWRHKAGLEDLKKASVYLNWTIESVEGQDR